MKRLLFVALFLSVIACKQNASFELSQETIDEIKNLNTDIEKSDFLFELWHEDQFYRKGEEGETISKFGYNSGEHKSFKKKWKNSDNKVFNKLKLYLEMHGYPKNGAVYHELALNAFPIIIGHNHHYKSQEELLPYLYNAYEVGDCVIEDVVWVLGKMYESKNNGKRYEMKSNKFRVEQEFNELIEALNLNLEI